MQFYWHYKNGRIRVFQRQTAAFSPILSRQLSKFDLTGQREGAQRDQVSGQFGRGERHV